MPNINANTSPPSKHGPKSRKRGPKPRDLAQKARPQKWPSYGHLLMAFGIQNVSPDEAWAETRRGAVSEATARPNHGQNPSKSGSKTGLRRPSGKRGPKPRDLASVSARVSGLQPKTATI